MLAVSALLLGLFAAGTAAASFQGAEGEFDLPVEHIKKPVAVFFAFPADEQRALAQLGEPACGIIGKIGVGGVHEVRVVDRLVYQPRQVLAKRRRGTDPQPGLFQRPAFA